MYKKILFAFLTGLLLVLPAFAGAPVAAPEVEELPGGYVASPYVDKSFWKIQHRYNWYVKRESDGRLLQIEPRGTVVRGCNLDPIPLADMPLWEGVQAYVQYAESVNAKGGFHVQEVQILCK